MEDQTTKIFENLAELLSRVDFNLDHVVSVKVYIADYKRFHERMNHAYAKIFKDRHRPARSLIGVSGLTRGTSSKWI